MKENTRRLFKCRAFQTHVADVAVWERHFFTLQLGKEKKRALWMDDSYVNDYVFTVFTITDPMNASSFRSRRRGVLAGGDGGTCVL
jgi:hypothetical protein